MALNKDDTKSINSAFELYKLVIKCKNNQHFPVFFLLLFFLLNAGCWKFALKNLDGGGRFTPYIPPLNTPLKQKKPET